MSKSALTYVAVAAIAVALTIGVVSWVWQAAGRNDASRNRTGLTPQLMRLKSKSMRTMRDGLATSEYLLLEEGVAQLREVNTAAGWYLSDERYGPAGDAFREALERFDDDVERRDLASAKRSFDALTQRCLACHRGTSDVRLDADLAAPLANATVPGATGAPE